MKKITFCFLIILFFICQVNNVKAIDTNIYNYHLSYSRMYPNLSTNFIFCTTNNISGFSGNLPASINKNQNDTHWSLAGTVKQSAANNGFDDIYSVEKEIQYYTVLSDIDGDGTNESYNVTSHRKKYQRFRIDDFSDMPSYTNYRGVIKADDTDYLDGLLFKNVEWSEPEAGTISIPVDTDVFEIVTLNNTDLEPGIYCIQTALDSSAPVIPLEITVYEANGNNYGTQIGWTNAFTILYNKHQTVFFKINTAKKVFVRVNSTQSGFQGKYKIKCLRSKPVLLVHGIRVGPRNDTDTDKFCSDLDEILRCLGYTVDFLRYDSGSDTIPNIITEYNDQIEQMFTDSGDQEVSIVAHSFGATLTDLCLKDMTTAERNQIAFVITIGGVHRGSPFANIWLDTKYLGTWFGNTTKKIKDALEIGGAASEISGSYDYNGISLFAFNGSWGDAADDYYWNCHLSFLIPTHFDYNELDEGMFGNSDGMVPNFSACPSDIVNANERRLVYSVASVGMAHDKRDTIENLNTEPHITWFTTEVVLHGFFASLTNILAGGNIGDTDGDFTASVDQTKGCACKEYNVPGFFGSIYAENGGNEYPLWKQDEDINNLNLVESPYKILVAPAGTYSVKTKIVFERVLNVFYTPSYSSSTITTNIGTITVIGGRVEIY